jgi:DNA polymerase-3 subunit gamma/tau
LARKWRPKTFADTVGQEHVLKALVNALDSGRLHHAYLFTGTRGVGKTTIARILAKALNCEEGVTSEPCGECGSCREIDEGRFVDLIEVDAASKTKVDDTRDLLDNVQYAPSRGRYKVYLIDEVHMLSTSSFNALLKTLEEPPPHVKFLLATTDPQKLPVTVLSRCLQFNLKRLTPKLIQDRLAHICDAEGIEAETPALAMLARAADGSLRDALSLLDQAIAYCGGKVDADSLALMLGTIDRDHVVRLLRCLAENDAAAIIDLVAELDEQFPDYSRLLEDLARMLQRIAVYQLVGSADVDDEIAEKELSELAGRCPAVLPDCADGPSRLATCAGPAQRCRDDLAADAGVQTRGWQCRQERPWWVRGHAGEGAAPEGVFSPEAGRQGGQESRSRGGKLAGPGLGRSRE